jgi:membrane protease YdiL (CAAX protease family)
MSMSTAMTLTGTGGATMPPLGEAWRRLRLLVGSRDALLLLGRQGRWRWPWALLSTVLAVVGILLLQLAAIGVHWMFTRELPGDLVLDPKVPSSFLVMLLSFLPFMLVPYLLTRYLHKASWRQLIASSRRFEWRLYVRAAAAGFVVTAVVLAIDYAVDPSAYRLLHHGTALLPWLVVGLAVIFVQTLAEEILFRGYLLRMWGAVLPYRVLTTSLVMGLFISGHFSNADFKTDFWFNAMNFALVQIVWSFVWFRTQSVAATAGLHWANNVTCFFIVATVPGQATNMAIASNSDAVLLAGGSHLLHPYAWFLSLLGLGLTLLLLVWRSSPFYLPVRRCTVSRAVDEAGT